MERARRADDQFDADAPESAAHGPGRRAGISIAGILVRFLVAVGIVAAAGWGVYAMLAARPEPIQRQPRERTFTVSVMEADTGTYQVNFESFGEIVASRTVDIRPEVAGEVTEVSDALEVGGTVARGERIARIDSYDYDMAVSQARDTLADARLSLSEARQALGLRQSQLEAARTSLRIAQNDLQRARTLNEQGSLTSQEVENRELTVSERRQAVNEAENAVFSQQAAIERQQAAVDAAQRTLEQAKRDLANTAITAPFTGVVTARNIALGSRISASETVASLYDPEALDVRFTVSDRQYGKLAAAGLMGRDVTVIWNIDGNPVTVTGEIARTAAEVDSTTGGVTLYARLTGDDAGRLRPGTFVEVSVAGPAYPDTLRVPESAVYESDHIYTMREGRMARIDATIMARDNDQLILAADVPAGEPVITTRLSQAGEGVAVQRESAGDAADSGRPGRPDGAGTPGTADASGETADGEPPASRDDGGGEAEGGDARGRPAGD